MKPKSVALAIIVWIAVSGIAPLHGQDTGFRIGQAQPAQAQHQPASSGSLLIAPMTRCRDARDSGRIYSSVTHP